MKRTHDQFYLNENNKNIKQSFIEVANEIDCTHFTTIADVGCANGAFPNYLSCRFPNAKVTGIDFVDELLAKAKNDFPHIPFNKGNVLDKSSINEKFDIITMLGVLCIFDNYKFVLENVLSWLKPRGTLILHNMINDYDWDVFVKYQPSSLNYTEENLESGWNILSEKSLKKVVTANNASIVKIKPFNLNIDLEHQDDSLRSWTEINPHEKREIYNGLNIRQPQKIVVIEKLQ